VDRYDTTRPDPARRYDYWLGGKDNLAVDRRSGDLIAERFPTIRTAARENRRFLQRAVTVLAETGIDQFLDIGTGLPTAPNVHQIAHQINPHARVVYVDNSPLVLAHARALLTAEAGAAPPAYIDGDLRQPHTILNDPALRATLDLDRPVALLLVAVLHFITDDDHPADIVHTLLDALPTGSYLALTHLSGELLTPEVRADFDTINTGAGITMTHRDLPDIQDIVTGLDIEPPGIVPVHQWRPDNEPAPRPATTDVGVYGLLARKPHTWPATATP
jgi:hypothetical protein